MGVYDYDNNDRPPRFGKRVPPPREVKGLDLDDPKVRKQLKEFIIQVIRELVKDANK